ncbi:MAG TPA: P1 family peptidase [Thermoanaerobaculia bacterium]|nr:P1 family peptidase [Thermoanaerobaculia bacterium]
MAAFRLSPVSTYVSALVVCGLLAVPIWPQGATRIRDLGARPGILPPGEENAITDVAGVMVGHRTLIEGDGVRTGVTAILPHGGPLFRQKVAAAVHVENAFGKAAGFLQVRELGTLETPIVLTNTLSVGTAVEALVAWTLEREGNEQVRSVNAVVGETNDGFLNDIRSQRVDAAAVHAAIEAARGGPVTEGAVGAGTGTVAFGWKGGIGTSSRRLPPSLGGFTVGALVQSNFGGVLTIDGVRVGEALGRYSFQRELEEAEGDREDGAEPPADSSAEVGRQWLDVGGDDGSCMIVLATDAPLDARQLERLARRAPLGLARTGSFVSHGSGDFVIAFSTTTRISDAAAEQAPPTEERTVLREDALSPLFLAAVEAVEESIYNSLTAAETMTGHRGTIEALPLERVGALLSQRAIPPAG